MFKFFTTSYSEVYKTALTLLLLIMSSLVANAQQILPDEYEPDNNRSSAKSITFNSSQTRTMHFVGFSDSDDDFISFFLPEPAKVTIEIAGEISLTNISIQDSIEEGFNVLSTFFIALDGSRQFTTESALKAGLYYIIVDGAGHPSIENRYAEYTISISKTPSPINNQNLTKDQYEPDDSIFSAAPTVDREIQNRSFHHLEDIDWIAFRISSCVNILAENAAISAGGGRIVMRLWNERFDLIETVISEQKFNEVVGDFFLRELRSGVYYISLSQFSNQSFMLEAPDPYAFRISGFFCDSKAEFMPPIINYLLAD